MLRVLQGGPGWFGRLMKVQCMKQLKAADFLNDCSEALSLKQVGLWRVSFTHLKGFVVRIKH